MSQPSAVPPSPAPPASPRMVSGTAEFKRTNRALFFGGFSTFGLLYCIQPLMPLLSKEFALTAAQSSLSLSVSTAALALSMLVTSAISDRIGRKGLMVAAMLVAALMTLSCALVSDFSHLLLMRTLLGAALGGIPAIAMTYLGEEIDPASLGLSMGLYIAGSAFGGMVGRLASAVISDFFSWRLALGTIGFLGLLAGAEFWRSLPRSRHFQPSTKGLSAFPAGLRQHFSDPGLPWLFVLGFILVGSLVSLYNYIAYRLLAPPFALRQSVVGAVAFFYLLGMVSSVWAGRLSDRLGRRRVLWMVMALMVAGLLATLFNTLWLIVPGIALFTFGFFASHSVASSWVSRRARAPQALASALYLFFYYLGSSVLGSLSGVMWGRSGWNGVVVILCVALGAGMLITLRLRTLMPLAPVLAPAEGLATVPTTQPATGPAAEQALARAEVEAGQP